MFPPVKVKVKILYKGAQVKAFMRGEMKRRLQASADAIQGKIAQKILTSTPLGIMYKDKRVGWYRASRPGQYPAVRTGNLLSKIETDEIAETMWGNLVTRVGTNAKGLDTGEPYGLLLEVGRTTGRPMEPRPWLLRCAKMSLAKIKSIFSKPFRGKGP